MKYLVITNTDSMLLTSEQLRVHVVSGKIHRHNSRVFQVIPEQQRLHSITVIPWDNNIPWVDIIDIYGNLITTLKPNEKGE